MRTGWVAGMLAAMALAGCAGGEGGAPTTDFSEVVGAATEDTGIIRGVTLDPSLTPIQGANITLSSNGESALSDASGRFGFDGLKPGTYFLTAKRVGYASGIQQSVEVVAGESEPPIVKILLTADPSTVPFVLPSVYRGFISCSFKVANQVAGASTCDPTGALGYRDRDDASPVFDAPREPAYYQSEMTWQSSQQLGNQLVTIQWACPALDDCGDDDFRLCNVRGVAPLTCRVNGTTGGGGGGVGIKDAQLGTNNTFFQTRMFANCSPCIYDSGVDPAGLGFMGVGVVLEQTFEVYNHLFFGYLPPTDWTFLANGKVPPPPK